MQVRSLTRNRLVGRVFIPSLVAYKEIYRTLEVQPNHLTHVQVRSLTQNRLVGHVFLPSLVAYKELYKNLEVQP